jgi:hypothetical protein
MHVDFWDLFPCNLAMSYVDIERLTVNEKVATVLCAKSFTQFWVCFRENSVYKFGH